MIEGGKALITDVARARVPMPKSTRGFIERCRSYARPRQSETRAENARSVA